MENQIPNYALTGRKYNKAAPDGPVVSVLTFPMTDIAGDFVKPDGGNWQVKSLDKQEWIHPVSWTHDIPVGTGRVQYEQLTNEGQTATVAVGYTTFFTKSTDLKGINRTRYDDPCLRNPIGLYSVDDCLRAAEEVEALVRGDLATGVSIEFYPAGPKGSAYWDLEKWSTMENRPARHFEKWIGTGYAHARVPVNRGARTFLPEEFLEKAIRVSETKRLPNGRPLSDLVLKAFLDPELAYKPKYVATSLNNTKESPMSEKKEEVIVKADNYDNERMEQTPESSSPALRAFLDGAQGMIDVCKMMQEGARSSDDMESIKLVVKICKKLQDLAGEAKAYGEKKKAKVDKMMASLQTEEDYEDEPMEEPTSEEKAITLDSDGVIVLKAIPEWKPRRFKLSEKNNNLRSANPNTEKKQVKSPIKTQEEVQEEELDKMIAEEQRKTKEIMEAVNSRRQLS